MRRRVIAKNNSQIIETLLCKSKILNFSDKICQILKKLGDLKLIWTKMWNFEIYDKDYVRRRVVAKNSSQIIETLDCKINIIRFQTKFARPYEN